MADTNMSFWAYAKRIRQQVSNDSREWARNRLFGLLMLTAPPVAALLLYGVSPQWATLFAALLFYAVLVLCYAVLLLIRAPWKLEQLRLGELNALAEQKRSSETTLAKVIGSKPNPKLTVKKIGEDIFVLVRNEGRIADVCGRLRFGSYIHAPRGDVFAKWYQTKEVKARIPKNEEYRLLIATRHLDHPAFSAVWEFHYTSDSGPGTCSPHYSFLVKPEYQAENSPVKLYFHIETDPDPVEMIAGITFTFGAEASYEFD